MILLLANLAHSVSSVSVVLLLTATGYVCAVRGWIGPDAKAFLSRFIMTVAIPCMCIYGLTTRLTREMLAEYGRYLLVPLCCISLNYLPSFLLGRLLRLPRRSLGVFVVMCSMSNTMFIGYAMCYELFGEESVPYIMLFYLVSTMFTQVVGLSVIRWAGESQHPSPRERLRFLTSPAVLGVAAGFTLVLLGWPLPSLVRSYMGYMNGLVSPLALVLTGKIIHDIGLRSLRLDRNAVLMLLFRFVLAPGMVLLACSLLDVTGLARSVFVIEAAMPVVTVTVVAAAEYGADERLAAQGAAVSTIACFFVIPILMLLL